MELKTIRLIDHSTKSLENSLIVVAVEDNEVENAIGSDLKQSKFCLKSMF